MNKQDLSQDKKSQILDATTNLLKNNGLQALSFNAVAKEAGLSRQLVRYYYSELDDLIVDLCAHLGNSYREALVAGILEVAQVERLKFFLDYFFDLSDAHPMPDNLEAYDSLVAYAVGSDALKGRLCDQYKTLGTVITHELAITHPELSGHDCEELSYLFVSMMHAHWSFVATLGYSREHSQLTRRAIDRLIQSYLSSPTTAPTISQPWLRNDTKVEPNERNSPDV